MVETEQVKPLAPSSSTRFHSDNEDPPVISLTDHHNLKFRRRKYVLCCGCITAFILIIVVTFLIFSFTIYNLKEPELRTNRVALLNANLTNDPKNNITLIADVSVKNPNVFPFRFGTAATVLYYNGTEIGEGRTPPGRITGQRTLRLNVTVEIVAQKLIGNPNLRSDVIGDGGLNISSYTVVDGNVKVLNLFNRKAEVEMNCSVMYNITSGSTHDENCFSRVNY